jgi:hypothetical protein
MSDHDVLGKFPEGSTNIDFDIFEEFPDGSTVWRTCIFGMECVESKLRELSQDSKNKFFALNLHDQNRPVIRQHSRHPSLQKRKSA